MKYQKEDLNQKSKKSALENVNLLYESRQAVIKLFNILQLYLKLNTKQNTERVSKY